VPLPPRYRIHPAIGVARVGNAPADDFFLAPEQPNQPAGGVAGPGKAAPPFKVGGKVRRQAARFRIYEYTENKGLYTASREITADLADVATLTWTVHLANKKASFFKFDGLAGSPILPQQSKLVRRNARISATAKRSLEIDPGPRSISGVNAKPVEFRKGGAGPPGNWPSPAPSPALEYLGELRTDDRGRLIVIGGAGVTARWPGAADIVDYANNDGWFDDVSDGPVTAQLELTVDGAKTSVSVAGAWILVGPPDFAPDLKPTITLWDLLLDLTARSPGQISIPQDEAVFQNGALSRIRAIAKDISSGTSFSSYKPSFDDDVAPILRQTIHSRWVFEPAQSEHATFGAGTLSSAVWALLSDPSQPNTLRQSVLERVRKPGTPGLGAPDDMPRLLGDDPYGKFKSGRWGLSVTVTQYAALEQWAKGNFRKSLLPPSSLLAPAVAPLSADGLDRAALESASGGAFYPGIEVGWEIREPALFAEPFRIKHGAASQYVGDGATTVGAGYFSRQMALPWLADFLQCKIETQKQTGDEWGWWPSQRPDGVYASAASAAAVSPKMLPWHRATVGASADWPADSGKPKPRPKTMPSYAQMLANWWKFGTVTSSSGAFVESDRASAVP
jgi:hypothetical protein